MGCGKQVQGRPEDEYDAYVYDLKKDVQHLEESIERQEQLKQELEDEIAEIDPEKEDVDDNMLVDLTFGLAKNTAMTPIEKVTTVVASTGVSTDRVEEGIDSGWEAAETTVKKILNPIVNLIAQLSDLIYFGIGLAFALLSTYSLTEMSEYSYGPAVNTMYTMGILMMITGLFGIVALIRGNMGITHYQMLKRRRWKKRKKRYRRWEIKSNAALKTYHDDKKQYDKNLAKWKSEKPKDAQGNLLPEPKLPVQKEFKEPIQPGEEYIRPRMVKATATTKGGWARGDKDAAQDLKDREELADIRWDVLLWLKGVFVLKFILFLMMLFVVTIIFMLLYNVNDPIGTATDASWGPSVSRSAYDNRDRYLEVVDLAEEPLSAQKDFRIKFFQTDDPNKSGVGVESCIDQPQCLVFLNQFPDNLTPDPEHPETHVLTTSGTSVPKYGEYAMEPELRKTDKSRQFRECAAMDDIFLATTWEYEEWEKMAERYDDSDDDGASCTNLINTIGRIDGYETCSKARAANGLIPEVVGTLSSTNQPCEEAGHACFFEMGQLDAVLQEANISTQVRDLCPDTCFRMGITPGENYMDPQARSRQKENRDTAFAACHGCIDECKEVMNEGLREIVRPAAVGVWVTFVFTAIVWMWNNAATSEKPPPDPDNPRGHWSTYDWFMKGICIVLNSVVGCIAIVMIWFVYSMRADLDESCPSGDCASHFVAMAIVLMGITLIFMGWTCAYVVFFQSFKFMLPICQFVYLVIILVLLEFATLMSITTGDIPSLDLGEIRKKALYIMTHPDVCQDFDMTEVCGLDANTESVESCQSAPSTEDLRATAVLNTEGTAYVNNGPLDGDETTSPWYGVPEGGCSIVQTGDITSCEASCKCLELGQDPAVGTGIPVDVTEEMKVALESCNEFLQVKYEAELEYFTYFLLTSVWYCIYTLYFNQKAAQAVQKTDEDEAFAMEQERTKQFVQAKVRINQAQKLNVIGEEALYWALKCQKASEVGKVKCGNYKRDRGEEEEVPPPKRFQLPKLPTWLVGAEEEETFVESYETWADWPLVAGTTAGGDFKPWVKETMQEDAPLRTGGLLARMEAHRNFKRMTTKTEKEKKAFRVETTPDFGPNNPDFYIKANAGFIDDLMKENADNPNVETNDDRESYYCQLEQLGYMVDENSPEAHIDIVNTVHKDLDRSIQIEVTKKGKNGTIKESDVDTTMEYDKKNRLRRIKLYRIPVRESWTEEEMQLNATTGQYLRDAARWYFWEAKRRLESPSVQLQTRKIPKYYKHENLSNPDEGTDKQGFFIPGPRGSSKKDNEQDFVERSFRRLDPARFKNELADDVEQVPTFFGLCTKNEAAPVVPGVGDDAMTEWDIVCRGLDTLRKEEIRLQIIQLAKDKELQLRLEEEARLAAEEADRANAAAAARQEELDRQEEEFAKAQDEQEIMAEKAVKVKNKNKKKRKTKGGRRDPNTFANPVSMETES